MTCADNLNTFDTCKDLKVCSKQNSLVDFDYLDRRFPSSAIVAVSSFWDVFDGFLQKKCNVIFGLGGAISKQTIQSRTGYNGEYKVGSKMHSKLPLSAVTREDDPEWSGFVNAFFQSTISAKAMNITKETANKFPKTNLFGDEFENMFIDAIAEVGNIEEFLDRNNMLLRNDINQINTNGSTGLIYSYPFGDTEVVGPGPIPGGTLETILKRKKLRCGIRSNKPGFAYYNASGDIKYRGLDVDYCRALASSLFRSNREAVDFIQFVNEKNTSDIFMALANGTVDVVAGIGVTLERDVQEPTTGEGFSFSVPYFYDPPEGP